MKSDAQKNSAMSPLREFDRSLPMMLYRALEVVLPPFRAIFARFELTETQWRVLRALWDADGRMFNELARVTLIPAPSLVGVVDRLTRDGLVTRQTHERDRRAVSVCLTERGQALRSHIEPLVRAAYDELESRLTPQQWQGLYEAIDQLCLGKSEGGESVAVSHKQKRRRQRNSWRSSSAAAA
jgi:homoprotocatechuate degradation regulator HpaR